MPISLPHDLMVSVSGFRGRVGPSLTPELVAGLAAVYGAFLRDEGDGDHVIVGRDSRTSGPMFMRAAVAGLLSVGCRVTELGVVPTPTLMLAVKDADAAGGIGVTASHNPAEWNALKFAVRGGTFLSPGRMVRFRKRVSSEDPPRVTWDAIPQVIRDPGAPERHIDRILQLGYVDTEVIRRARIRVALDCVNGAGGVMMPRLLDRLGCTVHAIGTRAHGRFHRDPEPTAHNLAALGALVRESGARIGFAVDPDADRLSLVDERGRALGEDLTLALAADVVLRREPGPWSPTCPRAAWWRMWRTGTAAERSGHRWGRSTWWSGCWKRARWWEGRETVESSFPRCTTRGTRPPVLRFCSSTWPTHRMSRFRRAWGDSRPTRS